MLVIIDVDLDCSSILCTARNLEVCRQGGLVDNCCDGMFCPGGRKDFADINRSSLRYFVPSAFEISLTDLVHTCTTSLMEISSQASR